jgi:hypothetical protein
MHVSKLNVVTRREFQIADKLICSHLQELILKNFKRRNIRFHHVFMCIFIYAKLMIAFIYSGTAEDGRILLDM